MMVPLAARLVIAIVGALLVLTTWGSVIGTLIVPRPAGGWLTRWVDRIINAAFRVVTGGIADHKHRDRVLAAQAAAILLAQLAAWLGIFYVGYSLLLWPFISTGLGSAFSMDSPAVFGPRAVEQVTNHLQILSGAGVSQAWLMNRAQDQARTAAAPPGGAGVVCRACAG